MLMDASVLVDLFVPSDNDERIRSYLGAQGRFPVVTDFGAGEFAGAIKRRHLMRLADATETTRMLSRFDAWCAANAEMVSTEPLDIRLAAVFVRRIDIPLRMPDAMYLAVAHRLHVPLCSFDAEQITAARSLGVDVVDIP